MSNLVYAPGCYMNRGEQDVSDNDLMRRFREGDEQAFEILYQRHRVPLFNFCLRMLGNRDRAADAMQECFTRMVNGAGKWKPSAKLTTWLYTIARNHLTDLARKSERNVELAMDTPVDPGHEPVTGDPPLRRSLNTAIGGLALEQREVFLLRAYSEMSFDEIAEIVGAPANTVKSRMRLAVTHLKRRLTEAGVLPETE